MKKEELTVKVKEATKKGYSIARGGDRFSESRYPWQYNTERESWKRNG